jgi:hypothetical protein
MPDLPRLESDTGTLVFEGAQQDERSETANPNLYNDPTQRDTKVHVDERESEIGVNGRLSAPRLAQRDAYSDDWRTALAEWVVQYESFCTQLQAPGYTFIDPLRDISRTVVMDSVEWTINAGSPYEIQFQTNLITGEAVLEPQDIAEKTANPKPKTDPMGVIAGTNLTGFTSMSVRRFFKTKTNPKAYSGIDTATKNEIVAESGLTHKIEYEGQFTGDYAERQSFDNTLDALIGKTDEITFQTAFPGYAIDGALLRYDSNFAAETGVKMHSYQLEFMEGVVDDDVPDA